MSILPGAAQPLLHSFAGAFTRPTFKRFLTLMLGAVLTTGRRAVTNLLRAVRGLARGHPSSYHRVFSRRRRSLWTLGHAPAEFLLRRRTPRGSVPLAGDDTADEHRGAEVYGEGRHRDPVRSTRGSTAYRWGHEWVVLAIPVRFPFATRPWASPVLVALYRSPEWDREHSRRHKTPARLLRQLTAVLLRRLPRRHFTPAGDGGYGSHEMARSAHRPRRQLTLISRFCPAANLYEPPPVVVGKRNGRPRKKGAELPAPEAIVSQAARAPLQVARYGGSRRDIAAVSRTGRRYRSGEGSVAVRWVSVRDEAGTHRDDYFFR